MTETTPKPTVDQVLNHGRRNYKRVARMVNYFFYKNVLFGFSIFWYNAVADFSGQRCYNDYLMSCYNLFFTSLPVLAAATLDQDVPRLAALRHPQLYGQVRSRHRLHLPRQRL